MLVHISNKYMRLAPVVAAGAAASAALAVPAVPVQRVALVAQADRKSVV